MYSEQLGQHHLHGTEIFENTHLITKFFLAYQVL